MVAALRPAPTSGLGQRHMRASQLFKQRLQAPARPPHSFATLAVIVGL